MKTKYVWFGAAAVLILAAAWFGRSTWRARHNLVSLHVRNAPLAEVISNLERQVGKKINADKRLDTHVTLSLKNQPLSVALDRLAQQCGARWSTVYAVYEATPSLKGLESALRGDAKLDEAGWKLVAPAALASPKPHDLNLAGAPADAGPLPPGAVVSESEDVDIRKAPGPALERKGPAQGQPVVRIVRRNAGGDGNSPDEEEIWSPTELVVESRLVPRLKGDFSVAATPEAASQAAHEINGNWKTYYVMRKSQVGFGFPGLPRMAHVRETKTGGATIGHSEPLSAERMDPAEMMRRERLNELGLLTPEQRVLRARESKQKFTEKR